MYRKATHLPGRHHGLRCPPEQVETSGAVTVTVRTGGVASGRGLPGGTFGGA